MKKITLLALSLSACLAWPRFQESLLWQKISQRRRRDPAVLSACPRGCRGRRRGSPALPSRRLLTASSAVPQAELQSNPVLLTLRSQQQAVLRGSSSTAKSTRSRWSRKSTRPTCFSMWPKISRAGTKAKFGGWTPSTALAFHPQFAKNRYCYVCYVLNSKKPGRAAARRQPGVAFPRDRYRSAALRSQEREGHHHLAGGRAQWRRPALRHRRLSLYFHRRRRWPRTRPTASTRARTSATCCPPILRIDVDHEDKGKPYAIPADNPFVKTPGRAAGDLGLRFPQSVADEFRSADRRPVGRRRRLGAVGDGLPRQARGQLRLVDDGRAATGHAGRADAGRRPFCRRTRPFPTPKRRRSPAATSTAASGSGAGRRLHLRRLGHGKTLGHAL